MALNAIHDTIEEIPEAFRELYTQRNGKYELTGIAGVKTQADVDRLSTALTKERNDHTATKDQLKQWSASGLKLEEVQAKLDKYEELEAAVAAGGTANQEKIDQLVETRIKGRLAPIEREKQRLTEQLTGAEARIGTFEQRERQRKIHDAVRKARVAAKVIDTAEEDVLMLAERVFDVAEDGTVTTKDQVGCTPGLTPDVWLTEMSDKRPHWWPGSQGGGAQGARTNGNAGVKNPWSKNNWNLTEQGRYITEHGQEKAEQLASLAGSKVGATHPTTT